MITRSGTWIWMSLAALALLLLWQPTARADSYNVTINTSSLVGSSSGPFQILVALEDANGYGDGNNTATISDFNVGSGSVGALSTGGGVSGSLAGSLTFTDSTDLNYAMGDFTPGSTISFTFSMTSSPDSNPSATGFPGDEFLFFILDGTGNPITTTDGSTPDTFFLAIVQGSSGLSAQGFNIPGAAPTVVTSTSVPEPSTILLLCAGILALGLLGFGARRHCWAV